MDLLNPSYLMVSHPVALNNPTAYQNTSVSKTLMLACFLLALLVFRIFLGIQINFSHEDYSQIYLIGLENALSGKWSYWGPDVVWSQTRLPGAMQGLLAGIPLRLTNHPYSPIILSNIISFAGLILLGFYAKRRFPKLSLYFLLAFFSLSPFTLFNGVVLLNTAYLIFTGVLLAIVVFELFLYRNDLLLNTRLCFFILGFALLFTYQLHLTWVMFLPFILVLFYLEVKRAPAKWGSHLAFFAMGCMVSGLTLLPTLITYGNVMMTGSGGNISLHLERLFRISDLFVRYLGTGTFDVNQKLNYIKLFADQGGIAFALTSMVKLFAGIQFVVICVSFYFLRASLEFRKTFLLFLLTLLMALFLYILSNKHLEVRTYILLYPFPIWLTLFTYSYLLRFKLVRPVLHMSLILVFSIALGIAMANCNDQYSFRSVEAKIEKAIHDGNPYEFAERRKTLMDKYN